MKVDLLRRMNESGILQSSNYSRELLDLSKAQGQFRRKLVGTEDVDEKQGIFNEYDYDWDLVDS